MYWTYILYTFIDHKLPRYLKTFTKSVEPSARTVKQNIKCIFFNSPKVPQYNLFSRNHATSSTVTSKNPGIHKEKLLRKQKRSFTSSLLHKAKLCECLLMKKNLLKINMSTNLTNMQCISSGRNLTRPFYLSSYVWSLHNHWGLDGVSLSLNSTTSGSVYVHYSKKTTHPAMLLFEKIKRTVLVAEKLTCSREAYLYGRVGAYL